MGGAFSFILGLVTGGLGGVGAAFATGCGAEETSSGSSMEISANSISSSKTGSDSGSVFFWSAPVSVCGPFLVAFGLAADFSTGFLGDAAGVSVLASFFGGVSLSAGNRSAAGSCNSQLLIEP